MFHKPFTSALLAAAVAVVAIPTLATSTAHASGGAPPSSQRLSVHADFNGDGFADLAVGVPFESYAANSDGGVNVIYGSASGLTATGNQFWSQSSPGILDIAEDDDHFGSSLAAADFNADGFTDLAVGVPYEDFPSADDGGAVNVIYGSASGLTATGNQFWSQDSPGIVGFTETGDRFGHSLAAADFGHNSPADLAIGVPYENVRDDGGVNIIYGHTSGLNQNANQFWNQDSKGIQGTAEEDDYFGYSLAAANLGRSAQADLAIGVPWENSRDDGGVNVIYGSTSGLTEVGNQFWSEDSTGIQGTAEENDGFGRSLAAADFGKDSYADLAIGVPFEDGTFADDGAVHVIYGGDSGLTASGNQYWTQDSASMNGVAQRDDQFGFSLAAADFGHDTHSDLAIGVPSEDYSVVDDGAVNVIYGGTAGLTATGNQYWSQDSAGVVGEGGLYEQFGRSLVAANLGKTSQADLVVGIPEDKTGSTWGGSVNVLYGASSGLSSTGCQLWNQDTSGMKDIAELTDSFGDALAAG